MKYYPIGIIISFGWIIFFHNVADTHFFELLTIVFVLSITNDLLTIYLKNNFLIFRNIFVILESLLFLLYILFPQVVSQELILIINSQLSKINRTI